MSNGFTQMDFTAYAGQNRHLQNVLNKSNQNQPSQYEEEDYQQRPAPQQQVKKEISHTDLIKSVSKMSPDQLTQFKKDINKIEIVNAFNEAINNTIEQPQMASVSILFKLNDSLVFKTLNAYGENVYTDDISGAGIILTTIEKLTEAGVSQLQEEEQQKE